jgi:flagellar hook protein FlgE
MGSALWAGISGLNASSKEMDVIANNIANVNTIGYKAGKTFFADVLSQSISGGSSGSMQVGRGVEVTEVGTLFGPGSFETTGNATDVAIDGDGFFMVNDEDGATFYTRAGAFHLDSNGNLVDTNGFKLQGYNFFGANTGMITDISLRNVQSAPTTTTEYSVGVNLDSETVATDTYTTTQTVYDSLGDRHSLGITFTKTATNGEWNFQVTLDGVNAACPYTGLQFDSDGNLDNIYNGAAWVAPVDMAITFAALANGATIGTGNVVNWDLTGTTALSMTQYASASVIKSLTNDGYASGLLKSLSVRNDGTINGFFTNGQTSDLAQLVLGDFDNTWGLKKMGSNLFAETVTSGPAIRNVPGASGMGDVSSNSLEMSNSDLATEFVNMITAQKAYSANARVITTQDQMMTELMNIKR